MRVFELCCVLQLLVNYNTDLHIVEDKPVPVPEPEIIVQEKPIVKNDPEPVAPLPEPAPLPPMPPEKEIEQPVSAERDNEAAELMRLMTEGPAFIREPEKKPKTKPWLIKTI